MKYEILLNTPFGFVFELLIEGCYHTEQPYELFLNGAFCRRDNRRIVCLFGLRPNTAYLVELKGLPEEISFQVVTQDAGYIYHGGDFGAAGDGISDDTAAINAAIYMAPVGGVVRLSPGRYRVSHLFLKSGVDLYLEEGAALVQDTNRDNLAILKGYQKDYHHTQARWNAIWEGNPLDSYAGLICGRDVKNIRIYGAGVLDGSGQEGGWWENAKVKKKAWRPRNIFLNGCKDVTIAGLTSRNSASWNIHPIYSDDLSFYGLTIQSDPTSPNTDGLNPESCHNVTIAGCHFQVGDDCIALKAGKYYMSRHHHRPTKHVRIRGCYMEEGHGGVVIGSEMSGGVYDVTVEHCLFARTDRGLRIKTRRGRGDTSVAEGIGFRHVRMEGVRHCFVVNMYYFCDPDGHTDYVRSKEYLPPNEETPAVRDIVVEDVTATDIAGTAIFLYGLPESKVERVRVTDSSFTFRENRPVECPAMMDDPVLLENLGIFMEHAEEMTLENNRFEGPWMGQINGKEMEP